MSQLARLFLSCQWKGNSVGYSENKSKIAIVTIMITRKQTNKMTRSLIKINVDIDYHR